MAGTSALENLGFAYPLHVLRGGSGITQVDEFWGVYFFASFSFLGSWGLGAPHATGMKGRLTCASPGPGQGATFTLELPLAGEEVRS